MAESLKVGSKVSINGKETLGLGVVRFVGETSFQTGIWVGIELEQPVGKNDGSVQGQKYFTCKANHGLFVRENQVTIIKEEITSPKAKVDKVTTNKTSDTPTGKTKTSGSTTTSPVVKEVKTKVTKPKADTPTSTTKSKSTKVEQSPEPTPPTSRRSSVSSTTSTSDTNSSTSSNSTTNTTSTTTTNTVTPPSTPATVNDGNEDSKGESGVTNNVTSNAVSSRNESVDKLLRALKELNDFKVKAQDTIRGLQVKLKEAVVEIDKLNKDKVADKELNDKEKDKLKKESDKEIAKLQKEIEKLKEEHEEQIANLNENLEMVTLDREIAEEKAETLEQELDKLKGQFSILEMSSNKSSGVTSNTSATSDNNENNNEGVSDEEVLALMEQNDKLKEALLKLRDLSLAEKQEKDKRIKDLERENKIIPGLQDKLTKLENDLNVAKETLEELTEALDTGAEAEQMVEQLTEKNLNLEEQISELQSTVEELEALRSIAEEIEENQNATEKRLRSEIYAKEIEILDQATVISNLKNALNEKDRMGDQFRSLVKSLQDQLNILKAKEEATISQANELSNQSHQLLSQNIQLQSKLLKASSLSIESDLSKLNYSQSEILVNFVKDYLPKSAFSQDLDSISVHLFFKRVLFKCQLILSHLDKYQLKNSTTEESFTVQEIEYFWNMKYLLEDLLDLTKDLDNYMDTSDEQSYLKLGALFLELSPLESKLDAIIYLLKEEELTSSFPLEEISSLVSKISLVHNSNISSNTLNVNLVFQRKLQKILNKSNILLLEEKKLQTILGEKSINKSSQNILTIPSINSVRRCIEFIKKLNASFKDYSPLESDYSSISDTLHNISQLIDQSIHLFKQIYTLFKESTQDLRDPTDSQLLDILNTNVLSKLELDLQWNWLDLLFNPIHNNIKETNDKLVNSGYPINTTNSTSSLLQDKSKKSPYLIRADTVKNMLSESVNLKSYLEEKNNEILELKKSISLRNNEIQELQWKEQALDKKIEKFLKNDEKLNQRIAEELTKRKEQEKMYTEALDTIQKDVDNLSQDNRSLKEKLSKLESARDKPKVAEVSNDSDIVTSSAAVQELRSAIKYLRSECARLRSQLSARSLVDLDPINTGNILWSENSLSQQQQQVIDLNKELSSLVKDTRLKCATATVVPLSNTSSNTSSSALLKLKTTELQQLASKIQATKSKILSTLNGQTESSSRFASFTPAVQENSQCLGKISIPIGTTEYQQRVSVNVATLDKLHTIFTQL